MADSAAFFTARVKELKLDSHLSTFQELRIETMGDLGYFSCWVPAGGSEEDFTNTLVVPILGEPGHLDRGRLRRLFVEAYAHTVQDVQRRSDPKPLDVVPVLPVVEREARRKRLIGRLPGLQGLAEGESLNPEVDPSYKSMDLAQELVENNCVKPLQLSMMTTRRQELKGTKTVDVWKEDKASGYINTMKQSDHGTVELGDLMAFRQALTRRSIVLEIAQLVKFEVHELWAEVLVAAVQLRPLQGFRPVDMAQCLRADDELWVRLASRCREGVRQLPSGEWPLEVALKAEIFSPDMRMLIAPLPGGQVRGQALGSSSDDRVQTQLKSLQDEVKRLRLQASSSRQPQPRHRSRSRRRGVAPALPAPKKATRSASGPCRFFNMKSGCNSKLPAGERCRMGVHVCNLRKDTGDRCLERHSAQQCPQRS